MGWLKLTERLTSISAVILADAGKLDANQLHYFIAAFSDYCVDAETVIVANGVDDQGFLTLKRLVADVPDCSCYVIADTIDSNSARIFGMEAAVGDYVLLANAEALTALVPTLPAAIQSLRDGFDLVIALPKGTKRHRISIGIFEQLIYGLLSILAGFPINRTPSDLLILSREAVLHILSKPNAELLLKAGTAGRGFPVHKIDDAYQRPTPTSDRRTFAQRAAKAISLLVSVGAVPVRIVSIISLLSGVLSIVYAAYVVVIYLFKSDVATGWTTLSLQISGMMFLLSLMLALLSEYIIQIYAATAVRRRRQMARELRSEKTARVDRPISSTVPAAIIRRPDCLKVSRDRRNC